MPRNGVKPKTTNLPLSVVAEQLGVSIDTVRRLIRGKELRAVDLSTGRVPRWYVPEDELARFINRRTAS
jgi:excisionase family DNA binding protein